MALLYIYIPLLLSLSLPGTVPHTLQQHLDEAQASPVVETHSAGLWLPAPGIKEQATQEVLHSSGWFSDTLDVTTRPTVTWSRRPARPRQSPPATGEEEQEEEDDVLLTVKFMKEDHPLILDLHPTRDLLAASYRESSGDTTGEDTLPGETRATPCEYQGVVRGEAEALVALSVCGGLSGVVAVTLEGGKEVELLVEPSPGSTSARQPHRVFSSTLVKLPERAACGVKDTDPTPELDDGPRIATADEERTTTTPASPPRRARRSLAGEALWFQKSTRFVELVLVADNSFFNTFGSRTHSRCKAIVNVVNAMYRPLGVVVVLSHLEVWERGDKIQVSPNYVVNLRQFKQYRREMKEQQPDYNNDNTMLLTTVDFTENTLGAALTHGMCRLENSVGMVQDVEGQHVGVTAFSLTHEMGHNFGMLHDEDPRNKHPCHCGTSVCVMNGATLTEFKPHVQWSSCSKDVIQERRDSQLYECLRNVPTRMYPSSSCGDGVVDDGEQCDCGPEEFCDNPCCVAATCRLAVNASCASGPCCDAKKCQLKPAGVRCREAVTECDLPEFCSGDSELCPLDVTKADGTPCRKGQGYCYEARCGSHEGQCQRVWGSSARMAEESCYSEYNVRGESNGNCGFKGHTKTEFLPCKDEDSLCGSLHCLTHPHNVPKFIKSVNFANIFLKCYYIVSNARVPPQYWLTPDGAKCGHGKMCQQQKCVTVPEASGHCRGGCSGRGVCNSRNHCHCDPGFAPPDCSKEGDGGSIDSNRIGRSRYKDPLWEALFILCLIALGAAVLLCCLWSHVRRWWEAGGRSSMLPCCARCLDACCCALMSFITDSLCTRKNHEKDVSKEVQGEWEQDRIICQVDLDLKDKESHTHSWDVANERLVTEVATNNTKATVGRPKYMQSISVDSGCVSDMEETIVEEPLRSSVSMKSLVSIFKKFGVGTSPSSKEEESSPPTTFERQQSMPLRRFVVDPFVTSRRSRHGTPPPEHVKHDWRRSVSFEVQYTATTRPADSPAPPPPPAPSSQARKPILPPDMTNPSSVTMKTRSKNESVPKSARNPGSSTQQQGKGPQKVPKQPLLPPVGGHEGPRAQKAIEASTAPCNPPADKDFLPPSTTFGRVKQLAKKLDNQ